jgi:hypothetical protein
MAVRWLAGFNAFPEDTLKLSVPAAARARLITMGEDLSGTDDLVAVYITLGPPDFPNLSPHRGLIAGTVRMLSMPRGKQIADYPDFSDDRVRWPIGWPCEVVSTPKPNQSRALVNLTSMLGIEPLAGVLRFGPLRLEGDLARLARLIEDRM